MSAVWWELVAKAVNPINYKIRVGVFAENEIDGCQLEVIELLSTGML